MGSKHRAGRAGIALTLPRRRLSDAPCLADMGSLAQLVYVGAVRLRRLRQRCGAPPNTLAPVVSAWKRLQAANTDLADA